MPYCPECSIAVPEDVVECPTCGASLESTPTTEPDGLDAPRWDLERLQATLNASLAPNYQVLRPLGQGGMGAIFLAREPALKRLVAIKVLAPNFAADKRARVRFEREARAAAAISHPNVVRVYAVGETKRTKLPYIIMQYVDGPNLEEWRLRRGKVGEREARRVIGEIAAALAAAHERDFVHRDVKPSNVLIEAETGRAFVADFGVSAAISTTGGDETKLTSTGVVVGTPTYMSPEQSTADPVTPKSDVYSLGIVAYQLLTGELPFRAETAMGWAAAHLRDRPSATTELRPEISPAVGQMIDRCIAKSPKDRPDAEEIARGMLPSLETEIEWPPPGLLWLRGRARGLNRMALTAAVGALLATTALSVDPGVVAVSQDWLGRVDLPWGFAAARRGSEAIAGGPVLLMYLWQTAVIVGLVTFGVAGISFLFLAVHFLERAVRQRTRGWHTNTIVDVAADHDGRSGLILTGSGDFAPFRSSTRRKIILARRALSATLLAGTSWIIVTFGVRVLLLALGVARAESASTLLDPSDVGVILTPGGAALVLSLAFILWERVLLGKLSRPHSFEADPEDVTRWYESHPSEGKDAAAAPSPKKERLAIWSAWIAAVALVFLGPVMIIGLILASLATFTATRFPEWHGAETPNLIRGLDYIDRRDPIGFARSLWEPYLPPSDSTPREVATELLRLLSRGPQEPEALASYDLDIAALFPWDEVERRTVTDRIFEQALRREIPTDSLDLLRRLANHPRTGVLRRLAATPDIDVVAALGDETPKGEAAEAPAELPVIDAIRANVLTAVLQAAEGDVNQAYARLGENASIGEHLLATPLHQLDRAALTLLANHVLLPIASLERARGEIDRAVQLARAADDLRLVRDLGSAAGLALDPENLADFRRAISDERVPSGYRILWLQQGWAGLCAYPREILLGPSARRVAAMRFASDSTTLPPAAQEAMTTAEAVWRWPFASARANAAPDLSTRWRMLDHLFVGSIMRVFHCGDPDPSP